MLDLRCGGNAEISVDLGTDGVAQVGDLLVFNYGATNVGSGTLEDLSAEYCFLHCGSDPLNCGDGAVTITTLTKTSIDRSKTRAYFYRAGLQVTEDDAEVDRFTVQ